MNTNKLILLFGLSAATLAIGSPAEQNWGQWRGPLGNGVSPNGNPPTEWSESKNVKWKLPIPGQGSASPIVWDNHVFIQTAIPTAKKPEARLDLEIVPQFA